MSFRISGLRSRRESRRKLSGNQVAAKERVRKQRVADADARMEREIAEAEEWARRNPAPKLPPGARLILMIPGLPSKTFSIRRWPDGKVLAGNKVTTAKAFGRKLGMLLDQFLP